MKKKRGSSKKNKNFQRILLPVDGSESSARAVQKALFLAKETAVDVTAIYVIDFAHLPSIELNSVYLDMMKVVKKQGNEILDQVKKQGFELEVKVKTKLVKGIPDDQIIKEAKKDDLIIMGCRGKTRLRRILIGSVCEKVLHHSKSPVMIVR